MICFEKSHRNLTLNINLSAHIFLNETESEKFHSFLTYMSENISITNFMGNFHSSVSECSLVFILKRAHSSFWQKPPNTTSQITFTEGQVPVR